MEQYFVQRPLIEAATAHFPGLAERLESLRARGGGAEAKELAMILPALRPCAEIQGASAPRSPRRSDSTTPSSRSTGPSRRSARAFDEAAGCVRGGLAVSRELRRITFAQRVADWPCEGNPPAGERLGAVGAEHALVDVRMSQRTDRESRALPRWLWREGGRFEAWQNC